MNNMLSAILAIIFMFTSVCGGMAGAGMEKPVSVDASLSLSGDLSPLLAGMGMEEEQLAQVTAVVDGVKDMLNAISLHAAADKDAAQYQLLAGGDPIVSAAVKANEAGDGWSMVSSLFPESVLTVQQATLDQFRSSIMNSMTSSLPFSMEDLKKIDAEQVEAITQAVMGSIGELYSAFMASAGEPETGSWEINGVTYTAKVPFNITTKELAALTIEAAKKIVTDENVAPLIAQFAGDVSVTEKLDEALEQVNSSDDAQVAPLDAATYANEAGESCLQILLGNEETGVMNVLVANSQSGVSMDVDMLGMMKFNFTADNANAAYSFDLTVTQGSQSVAVKGSVRKVSETEVKLDLSFSGAGTGFSLSLNLAQGENRFDVNGTAIISMLPILINGYVASSEDRTDMEFTLSLSLSQEAPLALTCKASMAAEAPVFEAGADLKTVVVEDLAQNQEAAGLFEQEVNAALQSLLEGLTERFPVITTIQQLSAPTDAPAEPVSEEPAA